jgi:hypothetical protein
VEELMAAVVSLRPFVLSLCTGLGRRLGGNASDWVDRLRARRWATGAFPGVDLAVEHGGLVTTTLEVEDDLPGEALLALSALDISTPQCRGRRLHWDRLQRAWKSVDAYMGDSGMERTIAYIGARAGEPNARMQRDALEEHGYDLLFAETASGHGTDRPQLAAALAELNAGDTLVCFKSAHFGTSAAEALAVIRALHGLGVAAISLTENFDVSTAEGAFMLAVLTAAADYEITVRAEHPGEDISSAKDVQAMQTVAKVNSMLRRLMTSGE